MFWDTVKGPNLPITSIHEREETSVKVRTIFKKQNSHWEMEIEKEICLKTQLTIILDEKNIDSIEFHKIE